MAVLSWFILLFSSLISEYLRERELEDDAILLETLLDHYPAHDGINHVLKGVKKRDAVLEVS